MDLEEYFYKHLDELQVLMKITSVYDADTVTEEEPYGEGVADALVYMRRLAFWDGFEIMEYEGHALGIRIPVLDDDAPKERIDIVSHLDVVEPGNGWSVDPFGAVIRDGRLYGRGSQDMKVSAFLTYLALKKLKEERIPYKREIRIVLGCDEERTMNDMIYYVNEAGKPTFAFTPDGFFPMSIGEKGALMWRLAGHYDGIVEEMDCGVQCNVVSPIAKARLKGSPDLAEQLRTAMSETGIDGTVTQENEYIKVQVNGKSAHASRPEDGHSATVDLLCMLRKIDSMMDNLYQCFSDPYGSQLEIEAAKEEQEQFTMNLGVFRISDGQCYGEVDGRYPFGMDSADLTDRLSQKCDLHVSLDYDSPPIMNDINDIFVSTLLQTYRDQTGDLSEPVISGGVSYSKIFGRCVGYGPVGPWMEDLSHQADESISLTDCVKIFKIYYEAIKRLALL